MDFFAQQDRARSASRRLIVLVVIAVIALIAAVNAVVYVGMDLLGPGRIGAGRNDEERLGLHIMISGGLLLLIGAGSGWKMWELAQGGGRGIAEMLGGRPIDADARESDERRLMNVVEEMSIASGLPMPGVYILDDEPGINAFAAGWGPGDQVVAVTRGALDSFSRDELQAVVGHEFSHLLNQDTRINLRLMGLVHGILVLVLAGRMVVHTVGRVRTGNSRNNQGGVVMALFALGLVLMVLGGLGWLFGQLIKAAVSRQREFLADASAVQFTRNPAGMAGALRRIAGHADGARLAAPRAGEASHLMFGNIGSSLFGLFATHPPLAERIAAIEGPARSQPADRSTPSGDPSARRAQPAPHRSAAALAGVSGFAAAAPATRGEPARPSGLPAQSAIARAGQVAPEDVARAQERLAAIAPELRQAAASGFSARALTYALFLHPEVSQGASDHARAALHQHTDDATAALAERLHRHSGVLPADLPLIVLHLALPALRALSSGERARVVDTARALITADGTVTLREFILARILANHLGPPRPQDTQSDLRHLLRPLGVVLSALAARGARSPQQAVAAHAAAVAQLRTQLPSAAAGLPPFAAGDAHAADAHLAAALDHALASLATATPQLRRIVLEACAACVADDGVLHLEEAELLRLIADSLDVPLPAMLN